jgi:hypothetical protein
LDTPAQHELKELLWICNIEDESHQYYIDIIESCFESIKEIYNAFNDKHDGKLNFEVALKSEDAISPNAGSVFGVHLIIFQTKLIVELINLYQELYGFEVKKDLTPQRRRRLVLAVVLAFCHELTHIIRGHDSTVVDATLPNNRAVRAAEADADFLGGMMLYKWYTGEAVGEKLMSIISLEKPLGLLVFLKDAGFSSVFLAFFIYNKFNSGNDEYHLPNVRALLLLAGFINGALSEINKVGNNISLTFSGYDEFLNYLKNNQSRLTPLIKDFLDISQDEIKELYDQTFSDLDSQRNVSDKNSEVWKVMYRLAIKNGYKI